MLDLYIQPQDEKKGRSFHATCVAIVTANYLLDESNGETIRPVWGMFAGSEAELRPFMANLRLGRKAEPWSNRDGNSKRVEFLKSSGFGISWQRETEGALATIYHPELFRLDPGMVDPKGLKFVMLVPTDWASRQGVDKEGAVKHLRKLQAPLSDEELAALLPTAYLFASYLDRRTRCPLIADGRFYLQILCAALHIGLASFPGSQLRSYGSREAWGFNTKLGFNAVVGGLEGSYYGNGLNLTDINICHAIAFSETHETFEKFLSEQVELFFQTEKERVFVPLTERVDVSSFLEVYGG